MGGWSRVIGHNFTSHILIDVYIYKERNHMQIYILHTKEEYIWERTADGLQLKDMQGNPIRTFFGHGGEIQSGEQRVLPGKIQRPKAAVENWNSGRLVCPECLGVLDNVAPGMCVFSYKDHTHKSLNICTPCGERLQQADVGSILSLYR